jgi:hypothetical protein
MSTSMTVPCVRLSVGLLVTCTVWITACGSTDTSRTPERPTPSALSSQPPPSSAATASFDYTTHDGSQYRFTAVRGKNSLVGLDSVTAAPRGKHYVSAALTVRNLLVDRPATLPGFAALTHLQPGPPPAALPYIDPAYALMAAATHPDWISPGGTVVERLVSNQALDDSGVESYGLAIYDIRGQGLLGYAIYG